jgi:hypothetical protein
VNDNPSAWQLELTDLGHASVALIRVPISTIDDGITAERGDDRVYRIMHDGHIRGFAVKYPNDRWKAFDESSILISEQDYSSPDSIVVMMKIFEAELTLSIRAAVAADAGLSAQRF